MHRNRISAVVLLGSLAAACGGGGATTPGAATQSAATNPPPGATMGAPTQAGTTDAPVATTGPAGGTAATACELLTVEEAAAALGTAALTQTGGNVAGQTFCDYRDGAGAAVLTTYMQASGAGPLWSIYESSLVTDPVDGIGDKAMFEPSTKLLLVLKGDTFFNVFVADMGLTPADALAQEKTLAQVMASKL